MFLASPYSAQCLQTSIALYWLYEQHEYANHWGLFHHIAAHIENMELGIKVKHKNNLINLNTHFTNFTQTHLKGYFINKKMYTSSTLTDNLTQIDHRSQFI